jgi:magnesium transporter
MSDQPRNPDLDALEQLVDERQFQDAATLLANANPTDAADRLQDLDPEDAVRILVLLDRRHAADILEELPDDLAADALEEMQPKEAAEIVTEMVSDEEADVLQEVSEPAMEAILGHLDDAQEQMARELLSYGEDTAGGLMQKEFIAVGEDLLATDARRQLQAISEYAETYPYSYIYGVDDAHRFVGVLSLRSLLFAQPTTPVSSLISRDAEFVTADTPAEALVQIFRRRKLLSLPVVDGSGRMLGIVSQEDAMRFSKEESEEEFLRFSGIAGGEEVRDMPLASRAGRRLVWLVIKMVLNIIPASVVARYTHTPAFGLLAPILPIISDMGGSGGSQAIAVSIRELSTGRIKAADIGWVVGKELGIGVLNGLVLGMLLGIGTLYFTSNSTLSLCVGIAMLANTLVAATIGGLMPLFLRKIRVDPAVASSPILTMVTDTCGFYFVLALTLAAYQM